MSNVEYVYTPLTWYVDPKAAFSPDPYIRVEVDSLDGVASYELHVRCPHCGKDFAKEIDEATASAVWTWYDNNSVARPRFGRPGGHVQDEFPSWSGSDREQFLMSGYCPECWNELMAPPDCGEPEGEVDPEAEAAWKKFLAENAGNVRKSED